MSNVICFPQAPLSLYLGEWIRDPISVSRKVSRLQLGKEGFKKLWACGSIQERIQCLALDPALADRHDRLLRLRGESRVAVTPSTIVWTDAKGNALPARTCVFQVMKAAAEGRKAIVDLIELSPEKPGGRVQHVLRMSKQWLLMSERFYGRQSQLFPRSPVFRYYRPS